jgi:protein tyrosine/serine phosphatase
MNMKRPTFCHWMRLLTPTLFVALIAGLPTIVGATDKRKTIPGEEPVKIKNFGKVNDHIYRGGQPEGDDYRRLVSLGVKSIVDLRSDNEPGAKSAAERAGLRYIHFPMEPKSYPKPDAAARFLAIVNDQANGPYYVHCAGGRHRTGALFAVYRMEVNGWDVNRAFQEMKDYDFYTRFGHGCYKDYVFDYSRTLLAKSKTGPATNGKPTGASGQRD